MNKCKSCDWIFLYTSQFNNYNLPIFQCNTCNLQKVHPFPDDIGKYYSEDYYKGKAEYSYIDERESYKYHSYVWDDRLNIIQKVYKNRFVNKKPKILEIGSSFGGFLSRAQKMQMEVQGVEISPYAGKYANDNGIPTYIGTLDEAELPENYYDIIVLSEVIEHLPNPRIIFDHLENLMSSNSILVIQTANFDGWQAISERENYHYYLPGHLYYYSESILKTILSSRNDFSFKVFYGSDVGLIAKWKKMRGSFKNLLDYFKWLRTGYYHWKSKFKYKGRPLTSGFVLYAFKGGRDFESVE
ncbi:MAG: class I SAM-dependent methyltransferase [Leptospira sp.]|nr:class I SAM-dependent methyltransferase [Leptospira sp.]